jgi:REP element-mobilizing transposase RayT
MYWRRRLPHWTPEKSAIFVAWRLAGTRPPPTPVVGPRWLIEPRIAVIVAEALLHGDHVRRSYDLFAWVVMPNHVHVVMDPVIPLSEIMRWLKTATGNRANKLIAKTGTPFWRREYYDRWIRSPKELSAVIGYVEDNPVRSGLSASPEEWRWSSAFKEPAARPPALP